MSFWYFRFEGRFREGSPTYGCKGVFSSCVVPESNFQRAKARFDRALARNKIDLIGILESFDVDGDELDPEDERNALWIKWCDQAKKRKRVVFDKWHVFEVKAKKL
jgi:hypothetical protein